MNKTAIVIAAVLATVILLSLGGVYYAVRANSINTTAQTTQTDQALTGEKEAAYQAQIQEANQRLLEAQATQQALEAEINTLQQYIQQPGSQTQIGGEHEREEHAGHFDDDNGIFGFFGEGEDD